MLGFHLHHDRKIDTLDLYLGRCGIWCASLSSTNGDGSRVRVRTRWVRHVIKESHPGDVTAFVYGVRGCKYTSIIGVEIYNLGFAGGAEHFGRYKD